MWHGAAMGCGKWAEGMDALRERVAPRFGRAAPRRRTAAYRGGLLALLERKNAWPTAEAAAEDTPMGRRIS